MGVCDLLGLVEAGAHEQDPVLPADRPVERRARRPALPAELPGLAEQRPSRGEGPPRMRDLAHAPADAGDGPAQRVAGKLRAGGEGSRFDLLADRLLGDVQVVGRPGEAPPLSHCGKGAQLAQLVAGAGHHTRESTPLRPGSNKSRLLLNNKLRLFIRGLRE